MAKKNTVKNIYLKFLSRKTTISLIAVISFVYALGLFIPQQSIIPPEEFAAWQSKWPNIVKWMTRLKLTSIYSSPVVIVLTALFFLNLLLVTSKRIPIIIKEIRLPDTVSLSRDFIQTLPLTQDIALENVGEVERVKEKLRALGFNVVSGDGCFKGIKNRFSSLGSVVFHVSFLLFLAGGTLIFHTRFWGETFVTEGQLFGGTRPEYRTISRLSELREDLPDLQFEVLKIEPKFAKMEPVSLKTIAAAVSKGAKKTESFDVNYPLKLGTISVLVTDVGVSPFVQVADHQGNAVFAAFISLNVIRGDEDHFVIPGTDYRVNVRFWPDYAVDERGQIYTTSFYLNKPLFQVTILRGGTESASGRLESPQDAIAFDGKRLSIGEIRYFGRFIITDEKGGFILITGFVLSIIGLMVKLVWTKREVYGIVAEQAGRPLLVVGYRAEYSRGLSRVEFERLLSAVR